MSEVGECGTMVLGIFGWPVAHSRSPSMHNAAAAALGLDARYVPFAVHPDALPDAVCGVRAMGIRGVNVTLPHKEKVIPLLDEVHPDAIAIGAVNTIIRAEDGRLLGENTDAPGLVRSLVEAGVRIGGERVVVLGAGGAARAAVVGLVREGAEEVIVAARRREQASALATALRVAVDGRARGVGMDELADVFPKSALVVQATSATLASSPHARSFADALPMGALPDDACVIDLVYQPRTTTVMARAEARGLRTVDGLGMLVHQGALAFTRWTGREAPVDVMRRALEGAS